MLKQLVENVERDLQHTTEIKNRLNAACDISWSLLCPPGKSKAGKFVHEKPKNSEENSINSAGSNSISQDICSSVTDLINYGKLVRSNKEVPSKDGKGKQESHRTNFTKLSIEEKTMKNKFSSSKMGRSTSLDLKTMRNTLPSKPIDRNHFTEVVGYSVNAGTSVSNANSLVTYSHSCSPKLSGPIHSIKMSEELNDLFRLFHSYIDLNTRFSKVTKQPTVEELFSKRFKKSVRSKLQHDLQFTNQSEKYIQYIDISEEAAKKKNLLKPPLIVQYNSKEQLKEFEVATQKLLALQLQSKVLNMIADYLSQSEEEI